MRLNLLKTTLFAIAAAGIVAAADKPDFSGNWKIDLSQSDFGGGPGPDSFTRGIEHHEPSLIMTDQQTSPLGEEKAVRKYTTDGKPTTYRWMGGEVKSAAHWEDNTLVIVGHADAAGTEVVITSRLTISADGRTLTELDKFSAGGSEGTLKIVLVRQ